MKPVQTPSPPTTCSKEASSPLPASPLRNHSHKAETSLFATRPGFQYIKIRTDTPLSSTVNYVEQVLTSGEEGVQLAGAGRAAEIAMKVANVLESKLEIMYRKSKWVHSKISRGNEQTKTAILFIYLSNAPIVDDEVLPLKYFMSKESSCKFLNYI